MRLMDLEELVSVLHFYNRQKEAFKNRQGNDGTTKPPFKKKSEAKTEAEQDAPSDDGDDDEPPF